MKEIIIKNKNILLTVGVASATLSVFTAAALIFREIVFATAL